jgi:hypothetical protein
MPFQLFVATWKTIVNSVRSFGGETCCSNICVVVEKTREYIPMIGAKNRVIMIGINSQVIITLPRSELRHNVVYYVPVINAAR